MINKYYKHSCFHVCSFLLLPFNYIFANVSQAQEIKFDSEIIQTRGLSPTLNDYFSKTPRFLPGTHSVQVQINGRDLGEAAVRFGEEGELCLDNDFIEFASMFPLSINTEDTCNSIQNYYPKSTVRLLPNQNTVELFLPEEAVSTENNLKKFSYGGTAGLLNYSLFSSNTRNSGSGGLHYSQASLEGGLNVVDWSLRSRYILTDNSGKINSESLYTYAEHVFVKERKTLQVGQINSGSVLFRGAPIMGVGITTTSALVSNGSGVQVSGIARTDQSRVEIRQTGQLIYSILVPAGPFTLNDIPVLRTNTDLDVTVVEIDGSTNHFIVPASAVNRRGGAPDRGLMMSAGQLRNTRSDHGDPLVFNVSDGWSLSPGFNLFASGILSGKYQATGIMSEYILNQDWRLYASLAGSRSDFDERIWGTKEGIQTSISLADNIGLSFSTSRFDGEFRELTDALNIKYRGYNNVYNTTLNWSSSLVGSLSVGYGYNQGSGDSGNSRNMLISWGRPFGQTSISANWQRTISDNKNYRNDDLLYVNMNIPLGRTQNIGTYMRNQGPHTSYGVQNFGSLSQDLNYILNADHDKGSRTDSINGGLNANLHYAHLSIGAGSNSNGMSNYNGALSGGIAMHSGGITLSPYAIRNAFGIVRLSEPKSGVEISTPQGSVWTDFRGQAVIPAMNEWRNSRIQVDANKLPQNMTLANGIKNMAVAHASVSEVNFKVLKNRRVMLNVKRSDGSLLQKGLAVVDTQGNYISTSVDGGNVFLTNADHKPLLYIIDENGQRLCQINYSLNDNIDENAFYEEAEGLCK
ncbi:fimbrial biogenesis usher protein (plasmid) [Enterobacter sp. D2]|uniref:fimbrial biogenesis usher protein n=1 Tax=Enterobacter sp. D2 TaxID=3102784 RepID=UPI002ACA3F13|nr:fimbrial biogenesis usher protein [Enterobacter sp. D2]MDZ5731136.1 fimbrial biogenesis usher protein [Enterobacter sp. D2]